jgi:hypothetical protein
VIDEMGNYSQHWIGEYPDIHYIDEMMVDRGRLRFGANAEFFPAEGIPTYENGVISMDAITQPTLLGYIFGGLQSNSPHTRGVPGAISGASNRIFAVYFTPVPEPGAIFLSALGLIGVLWAGSRTRRQSCSRLLR